MMALLSSRRATTSGMLLFCGFVLSALPQSSHAEPWGGDDDTVKLVPQDGVTILDMNTFGDGGFGPAIVSNIPVSILRSPEIQNANFDNPLEDGGGLRYLIKTSGCGDEQQPVVTTTLTPRVDEYGSTRYTMQVIMDGAPAEFGDFLPPSSFDAEWECASQLGFLGPTGGFPTGPTEMLLEEGTGPTETDPTTLETNGEQETSAPAATDGTPEESTPNVTATNGAKTSRAAHRIPVRFAIFTALVGVLAPFVVRGGGPNSSSWLLVSSMALVAVLATTDAATKTSVDGGTTDGHRALQQCTVNVEILYGGCFDTLYVQAPKVQLIEVSPTAEQETIGDTVECSTSFVFDGVTPMTSAGEWPLSEWIEETSGQVLGVEIGSGGCAVPGRPFRDAQGNIIMASSCENQYHYKDEPPAAWSSLSEESKRQVTKLGTASASNDEADWMSNLASEWTQRALGEHASIASFAAFTIALMSNRAPPELIRDSLTAAQDELRHATTAFELASLLSGGTPVEPNHLPATQHIFDGNLTALALGAAREGCIDETLSALELAIEVDNAMEEHTTEPLDDVSFLVTSKTKTIAFEEGRHAALAWRTLIWACSVDENVCHVVKRQVLGPHRLAQYAKARAPDSKRLAEAWELIHQQLVPILDVPTMKSCSSDKRSAGLSLVDRLVERIVREVACPDQPVE